RTVFIRGVTIFFKLETLEPCALRSENGNIVVRFDLDVLGRLCRLYSGSTRRHRSRSSWLRRRRFFRFLLYWTLRRGRRYSVVSGDPFLVDHEHQDRKSNS